MRLGYADPPYLGSAGRYAEEHPDALDWNDPAQHVRLFERLQDEFDGWVLHLSARPESIALYAPLVVGTGARWCTWVKGFAAFKRNVSVAYAHEPVLIKACRKPVVSGRLVLRDWIKESITLRRGLTGAKPEKVVHWAIELAGAQPQDTLIDMFPGTGAVGLAWETWRTQFFDAA